VGIERTRNTWIAGGSAGGAIDDIEGASENRGERKRMVDTARLDLAVNGGDSPRHRRRGRLSGSDIAVSDESGSHC
jgi:hypothetical protein